jgi:signal transduction histidine kinase
MRRMTAPRRTTTIGQHPKTNTDAILLEIADLLAGALEIDLSAVLGQTLEHLVPGFADHATLHILEENGSLSMIAHAGHTDVPQQERSRSRGDGSRRTRMAQQVMQRGSSETCAINDAFLELISNDAKQLETLRASGLTHGLIVPIRARGRSLGALSLARLQQHTSFTSEDSVFLERIARQIAVAVDSAQLNDASERQSRSLARAAESAARLRNLAAALLEATTPEDLARVAVDQGFSGLGASLGIIAHVREGELEVAWAAGQPEIQPGKPPSVMRELFDGIAKTGEGIWFESRRTLAQAFPTLAQLPQVPEAFLAMPLRTGRTITGVLVFGFLTARTFPAEDRQFVVGIARQYAAALERAQLVAQLEAERSSLQAVLQQMPSAVVIAEAPSGKLTLANRQFEEIWRQPFEAPDNLEVWHPWLGFKGDGQPYEPREWPLARAIRDAETSFGEEIEILRGDGSWGAISANAAPIRNRLGEVVAGVMAFQDVTARKAAEEELKHLNVNLEKRVEERTHELELRNDEMQAFVYTASHDLRSPLLAIQSLAYLMENALDKQDEPKAREMVGRINKRIEKMTHLLDDLLTLSRLSQGEENTETFDLGEVMVSVLSDLEPQINTSQMRVVLPREWPRIVYTKSQAYQLLLNLVGNALKYGGRPNTPPKAEVSWTWAAGDQHIILRVADNGPGIPLEARERVFSLFHKLNPNSNGTGVGLAIVKRIAERHGGRVWVEGPPPNSSEPRLPSLWGMGGATFALTLPGAERQAAD